MPHKKSTVPDESITLALDAEKVAPVVAPQSVIRCSVTIKVNFMPREVAKEIDAILREKFVRKVTTHSRGTFITGWYITDIYTSMDKVNSFLSKFEESHDCVLNPTITIKPWKPWAKRYTDDQHKQTKEQ